MLLLEVGAWIESLIRDRRLTGAEEARAGELLDRLGALGSLRQEERRSLRQEETRRLRASVMERAKGWCEACRERKPLELAHLLGGIGRRRQMQKPETCAAFCVDCHRVYDNGTRAERLEILWRWFNTTGIPIPNAAFVRARARS